MKREEDDRMTKLNEHFLPAICLQSRQRVQDMEDMDMEPLHGISQRALSPIISS